MTGRLIYVSSPDAICIRRANADPFAVPSLEDWQCFSPERIAGLGKRRLRGQVIAVLENGAALLRTASGAAHKVGFKHEHPTCGQFIEAVGWPETDLYRINLSNARWRPVQPFPVVAPTVAADMAIATARSCFISHSFHLTRVHADLA